jgi:hypothetical protein
LAGLTGPAGRLPAVTPSNSPTFSKVHFKIFFLLKHIILYMLFWMTIAIFSIVILGFGLFLGYCP